MEKIYHILNGDSLLEQLPKSINGERIVSRECLIDGPVAGKSITEFYKNRAAFIGELEGCSSEEYYTTTVPELNRITEIEQGSKVYLWFEDDLFCQVNFWFVSYLLNQNSSSLSVSLVRPKDQLHYGFAGSTPKELEVLYNEATPIPSLEPFASLWLTYKNHDLKKLESTANKLSAFYPFIKPAVQAHIDRFPEDESFGIPTQILVDILTVNPEASFGELFTEFCKQAPIYGFGDLQVQRLLKNLRKN